jgi:hypothetical protein
MRIGLIVEGFGDEAVCTSLVRRILPDVEAVTCITLVNKPRLISACGQTTAELIARGCDRILIIWDLHPAWREKDEAPCRFEDRQQIEVSLKAAGVAQSLIHAKTQAQSIHLVCIDRMLESWLHTDGRALTDVLTDHARTRMTKKLPDRRPPERIAEPKKELDNLFHKHCNGLAYNDRVHAIKIVGKMSDVRKIRTSMAFVRFEQILLGQPPSP